MSNSSLHTCIYIPGVVNVQVSIGTSNPLTLGVHRTLTPAAQLSYTYGVVQSRGHGNVCTMLEPGSGSGIGNKAIIISAKQQSHTEEYGVVYESSNHTRKNMKEYSVLHKERIIISS